MDYGDVTFDSDDQAYKIRIIIMRCRFINNRRN